MLKNYVTINTQFEGFHFWKDAPEEVKFLRDLHRHIFHVKIIASVNHSDRDIEIILLKRYVDKLCNILIPIIKKKGLSCEQIANILIKVIIAKYNISRCTVEVLEDNENGGVVVYEQL